MSVRAKVVCAGKAENYADEPGKSVNLIFHGVYEEEGVNKQWSKWTPCLTLNITIDNPEASKQFESGKSYFLDFSPVQ